MKIVKKCQRCRIPLPIDKFDWKNEALGQHFSRCRKCIQYEKRYQEKNKEKKKIYLGEYYKNNKEKAILKGIEYRKNHQEDIKNYSKEWRQKNREQIKKKKAVYFQKNKKRIQARVRRNYAYVLAYQNKRRQDPKIRLNASISESVRYCLKYGKNGLGWEELVGYTLNQLIKHLEKQFKLGMSWNNYGKWHVDHKVPVSAFNFTSSEHIDFKRCWALKNLQPLWARENFSKHATLDKPFQPSFIIS